MENHPTNAPPKKYKTGASGGDITHNAPLRKKPAQPDTGPNLYADHPAASAFQALYTGKQRRDAKAWLDYFTSPDFLEVYRERRFVQLLRECVETCEQAPPREMLGWLYAVYGIFGVKETFMDAEQSRERAEIRFQLSQGADFDGLCHILALAARGPVPKQSVGNELAVRMSFMDYRRLMHLSWRGDWANGAVGEASHILGRYILAYLKEKCTARAPTECERHPSGMRLITFFYETQPLPDALYRIAWEKFDLKNAVMGRPGVLYGRLREIVLDRLPEIAGEAAESFRQLKSDFLSYAAACYRRGGSDPERDRAETDAFFAREDLQRALLNRRFVEENLLHSWVDEDRCACFLQRISDFYTAHPEAPFAQEVVERAALMRRKRARLDRDAEDRDAPAPEGIPPLTCRPFFRHWINTGFHTARDAVTGAPLSAVLAESFPVQTDWSRRFLRAETDIPEPVCLPCAVDGREITVRFHLRHIDFLLDGEIVPRPFLPWDALAAQPDGDMPLFLLPLALCGGERFDEVRRDLERRLENTAAPEELRRTMAACLAGQVCRLPLPGTALRDECGRPIEPMDRIPYEWFAEDAERLMGCSYTPDSRVLCLFEQTSAGRKEQPEGYYADIPSPEEARALAEQLLAGAVSPERICADRLENLPAAVYADPDFMAIAREPDRAGADMPRELLGPAVTREALEDLLTHFARGRMRRLELSWPTSFAGCDAYGYEARRSLVFLRENCGYACLYFDDRAAQTYALIAQPELYTETDARDVAFVPFRQSRLFAHDVHRSFSTVRRHLDTVFSQASRPDGIRLHEGMIWSCAGAMCHGRHKYNLDKLLLGGFPLDRCHNRLTDRFYLDCYPEEAVCEDEAGCVERIQIGNINRDRLQAALAGSMQGRLKSLRLSWSGGRHAAVWQENGRYLLIYLDDRTRRAAFHVADTRTYMDVEGKKYPRDTFRGRVTPAYLIHSDIIALRGALEQLLASMEAPERFVDKFAEFADEKPVKPRAYEVVRAEILGS